MLKCLKITFTATLPKNFLRKTIKKHAQEYAVEGVAQVQGDDSIKIIICGSLEKVDLFLDQFYEDMNAVDLDELQVEPFVKDRDFRGVFRVLD